MSNKDDKLTVDLTSRPSGEDRSHSAAEWARHMELREAADTRRDIHDTRNRLNQFSVRFVTEAIYGEKIARKIFGEDGGQELVQDVVIDRQVWHNLTDNLGGQRARAVSQKMRDHEPQREALAEEKNDVSQQQVELLRALLKTMDPEVVKKALTGD